MKNKFKQLTAYAAAFAIAVSSFATSVSVSAAEGRDADAPLPVIDWTVDFNGLSEGPVGYDDLQTAKDGWGEIRIPNAQNDTGYNIVRANELDSSLPDGDMALKLVGNKELALANENEDKTQYLQFYPTDEAAKLADGSSIRMSFDIAFDDLSTSRWVTYRGNGNPDALPVFQTRGDGYAMCGQIVRKNGMLSVNEWHHVDIELSPSTLSSPDRTAYNAYLDGVPVCSGYTDKISDTFQWLYFWLDVGNSNFVEGSMWIDNIRYSVYENYTIPQIRTVDFNTGSVAINNENTTAETTQNVSGSWENSTTNGLTSGIEIIYENNKNVLHMWDEADSGYNDFQRINFSDSGSTVKKGEIYELSFSVKIPERTATNNMMINGFLKGVPTGDGKNQTFWLTASSGYVALLKGCKNAISTVVEPGWHDFKIVIRSGDNNAENDADKNIAYGYVDGRLIGKSVYVPQATERDNAIANTFSGFNRFWIGHVTNSSQRSDFMLGDLTARTFRNDDEYTAYTGIQLDYEPDLSNSNDKINSGIMSDCIYVDADTTLGELGEWNANNLLSAIVVDKNDNEITDENALLVGNYLKLEVDSGTDTMTIYFSFEDAETSRNTLWKLKLDAEDIPEEEGVQAGVTINETAVNGVEYAAVTYPNGVAGRAEDDYSIKLSINSDEVPSNFAPWINIAPSGVGNISASNTVHMSLSLMSDDINKTGSYRCHLIDSSGTWYEVFNLKNDAIYADTNGDNKSDSVVAEIKQRQWTKIDIDYYPGTNSYTLYVNGTEAASGKTTLNGGFTRWRMDYLALSTSMNSTMYLDDMEMYTGIKRDVNPVSEFIQGSLNESEVTIDKTSKELLVYNTITVQDLLGYINMGDTVRAVIYEDGTLNRILENGEMVASGNILAVTDGICYDYYKILTNRSDYSLDNFVIRSNSQETENTFAIGTLTASAEFTTYTENIPLMAVIAQYKDGELIALSMADTPEFDTVPDGFRGSAANLTATLDVEQDEGTSVKVMLWNKNTYQPVRMATELYPAPKTEITSLVTKFPGFTNKATVFSFDDGVESDAELIELFNKYGVKGTFNLVSNQNLLADAGNKEYVKSLYSGHEVANHIKNHPHLDLPQYADLEDNKVTTAEEYIKLIDEGKSELEEILGTEVPGMAWAYENPAISKPGDEEAQKVSDYVAENDAIEYARITRTSGNFEMPENLKEWSFTSHYSDLPGLQELFLDGGSDSELMLYSIWGHSYEFSSGIPISVIEDYLKEVTARNIWVPTCIEFARYSKALDAMTVNKDNIVNNSDVDLYVLVNFKPVIIKANSTYYLYNDELENYPTVYLAGDSTCEEVGESQAPRTGWGMMLHNYMNSNIKIENHAISSRSTKTFLSEGRLDAILETAKSGDYLFIQFGHNDSMTGTDRATTIDEYKTNLTEFALRAEEKGMIPVFLTSVRSCVFGSDGMIANDGVDPYRNAMKELGTELGVAVLDIGSAHREYLNEIGEVEAKKMFLFSGITPGYSGADDPVHFSETGADKTAELVANSIKNSNNIGVLSFYMK